MVHRCFFWWMTTKIIGEPRNPPCGGPVRFGRGVELGVRGAQSPGRSPADRGCTIMQKVALDLDERRKGPGRVVLLQGSLSPAQAPQPAKTLTVTAVRPGEAPHSDVSATWLEALHQRVHHTQSRNPLLRKEIHSGSCAYRVSASETPSSR
jgi:hypothetical protein